MLFNFTAGPFILMYHSVADNSDDPFAVSVDAFREQIFWLYKYGFDVISLSLLLRSIQAQNYRIMGKKVVITFDDGYQDFVANALPILLEHGTPATVFLVTNMLGEKSSWNKSGAKLRLMSEDEVRYIKAKGISLGSHTATHVNLAALGNDEVYRQLQDSYQKLLALGETFSAFSYPWGQFSPHAVNLVKEIGYQCAVVAGKKRLLDNFNIHLLPRFTITRDMTLNDFTDIFSHTNLTRTLISHGRALKNRFYNRR